MARIKKVYIPIFRRINFVRHVYQHYDFTRGYRFIFGITLPSLIKREGEEEGGELRKIVWLLTNEGLKHVDDFEESQDEILKRENLVPFEGEYMTPEAVEILNKYVQELHECKRIGIQNPENNYHHPKNGPQNPPSKSPQNAISDRNSEGGDSGDRVIVFWKYIGELLKLLESSNYLSPLYHLIKPTIFEFYENLGRCGDSGDSTLYSKLLSIYHFYHHVISKIVDYYMDYYDEQVATDFYALYLMGTYVYEIFSFYPYIIFWGEKRTGKSKNLRLARCLAFNPLMSAHISPASLFRLTEIYQPTLLIDESDPITRKESEARNLLLSGYCKETPVWRTTEKLKAVKTFQPEQYDLYSPKILAGIKKFDDVVEDRGIRIVMVRSKGEKAKREPDHRDPLFTTFLRPALYMWAILCAPQIKEEYDKFDEELDLNPREYEIFKGILVLAKLCGVYDEIKEYLEMKSRQKKAEEEMERKDLLILRILTLLTEEEEETEVSVKEIAEKYAEHFDEEISPQKVGLELKKMKITDRKMRRGRWIYTLRRSQVDKLLENYGMKRKKILEDFGLSTPPLPTAEDIPIKEMNLTEDSEA